MKTKFLSFLFLTFLSVFFVGCASSKPLSINTQPSGARVKITDENGHIKTGVTPARFELSPKKEYQIQITKPNYEPVEFTGSAYVQNTLTLKNAANTALVFICPPVGAVWGGARWASGDFKSFDSINIPLEPLQTHQKEVVTKQPSTKKREVVENRPRTNLDEAIQIEVEVFTRELGEEFDGTEGNRPRIKRRYVPAPRENDED